MFAGIIEETRPVTRIKKKSDGMVIQVDLGDLHKSTKPGDSVSIDGVCLTVTGIEKTIAAFDIMQETLRKTTLGSVVVGDRVNVEHSMRATDRIHGHFVQGHVFGLGTVQKIIKKNEYQIWITAGSLIKYLAPVGSIAVNGVSLTVANIQDNSFMVSLIPVTLERTNLGTLREGDSVNLEPDMIARQIVHFLEQRPGAVLGVK